MKTLEQLLMEWEEGRLSAESAAELKQLLASAEARRELVEHWVLTEAIRSSLLLGASEQPEQSPAAVAQRRSEDTAALPSRAATRRRFFPRIVWREIRISWTRCTAVGMAIFCVIAGLHLYFRFSPVASVAGLVGQVDLQRGDARLKAADGQSIYAGDRLTVLPDSAAKIVWNGGDNRLALVPGARVEVQNPWLGQRYELQEGFLSGEIASQPVFRPLRLLTSQAEVKVVGTRFSVSVSNQSTRLEVSEGAVRMVKTLASERSGIVVHGGQMAVAARGARLEAQPLLRGGFLSQETWVVPRGLPIEMTTTRGKQLSAIPQESSVNGSNIVGRLRGYLIALESGDYTFWVATLNGETPAELWLSTDANSAKAKRIAYLPGAMSSSTTQAPGRGMDLATARRLDWERWPAQKSKLQKLSKGERYYIEVLHGSPGIERLAIGWRTPGQPKTAPPTMVDTQVLCPFFDAGKNR